MKKLIPLLVCLLLLFSVAYGEEPLPILASFSATDLDGNEVDQTLFEGHGLTMINIWATYCNPCISELQALAKIHEDLNATGLQVVGILLDVQDFDLKPIQSQIDLAKEIMAATGVTYPQIVPDMQMYVTFLNQVRGVPCTLFVDEKGYLIGKVYYGARSEAQWLDIITPLLEGADQ